MVGAKECSRSVKMATCVTQWQTLGKLPSDITWKTINVAGKFVTMSEEVPGSNGVIVTGCI